MKANKRLKQTELLEEEAKKSIFIGICAPIKSIEDFDAFLLAHSVPDATHNCWAYRLGQNYRFNDDGEPSGTAGKPMLAAIDGAGYDQVAALVIRHYGGTKLGTGGLARAYGGVISRCLQSADFDIHVPHLQVQVTLPFAFEQSLHQSLKTHQGKLIKHEYDAQGLKAEIELPSAHKVALMDQLNNTTKGQARFKDA